MPAPIPVPTPPTGPRGSVGGGALAPAGRELALAWLCALLFAAVPFRTALVSGDHVLFAVDTATTQLPWSANLPEDAPRAPGNPDLSDQGIVFYPFYRWVSASWRRGDPPSWCPLIYAGAPGYGNAQAGAFDPQVLLLVALDALGGKQLFDRGLALVAWLRVAGALAGAFALARRLGLGLPGAALAGVAFGFGGFQTLWLNHPLGHVAPFLPWLLYFLEGIRGPLALRSTAAAGLALAGAILGGHVETAFFVGAAGGAWALALAFARDPGGTARGARATRLLPFVALTLGGLVGAVVLLPTLHYLDLSAAKAVREATAAREAHRLDLVALGLSLGLLGLFAAGARLLGAPPVEDPDAPASAALPRPSAAVPAALGLALALFGVVLLLARRGLGVSAGLALVPDRLGAPGAARPFGAEGNYIEAASAWVPLAVVALALAAALARRGALLRRPVVLWGGLLSFLLALELPGLLGLYRLLPLIGLGATVRLAVVSSLFLGLLAGEALERAGRAQRVTAVLVLLPLLALALVDRRPPPLADGVATAPERDELVDFARLPAARVDGSDSPFEAWAHPGVPVDGARLVLTPLETDGTPRLEARVSLPLERYDAPTAAARAEAPGVVERAPEGAVWLRTPYLLTSQLAWGHWRIDLEGPRPAPDRDGWTRRAAVFSVERGVLRRPATLALLLASCVAVALAPATAPGAACVVLVALAQAALFGRGVNPTLPSAMAFEESATERVLTRELGVHRFQADPGVLPADTGLVRGLRHVEGYDALDPKAFNDYRSLFLPAGVSPLLAWNARAVDHDDPAYRLLGVAVVAMREPWSHPRFELVASPQGEGEAFAETWIYRDREPLPRAFAVNRVVTLDEIGAVYREDPRAWDPLAVASIEEDWRPREPFTTASVSEPQFTNATVRVTATLDGDGLLILTDQHFPGWEVRVDGERRELLTANVMFRGVALGPGTHEVVFRYRAPTFALAATLSIAALTALLALGAAGLRRPDPTRW